jgi:hypothetical protein
MLATVARPRFSIRWGLLGVLFSLVLGCEPSPIKPSVDFKPPANITDLVVKAVADSSVTLEWTAVGDDGMVGTATSYDIRYSRSPITPQNFDGASLATGEPKPAPRGVVQDARVAGLTPKTTYYFGMKVSDEVPNTSGLSNVVTATTTAVPIDATAPAPVADLATTAATSSSITLSWTATGDDGTIGTASSYDLRYSTSTITEANWAAATQVAGEPVPKAAGGHESMIVSGLTENTLYYFALKVSDEVPNVSALSNVASKATIPANGFAFSAPSAFTTGSGPKSVAVGDLNGDLKPDLVTANSLDNTVSVLLGVGNGTFGAKHDFAAGASPNFAAIGDLKADGKADIVATNLNDNTASLFIGDGSGTFGTPTVLATGTTPYCVAIGELNGDGVPDLVTADNADNRVSVFLGLASGDFSTPPATYSTDLGPAYVALAHLHAGAGPDIVTANLSGNSVSVLLNSAGQFSSHVEYATGNAPYCVAVADVNGDGTMDLVTANSGSNTVTVLLGAGNGAFGARQDFATGGDPRSVAIADLNGDGKPDLVTANYADGSISLLPGNGNGTFGPKVDLAIAQQPSSVAIADVNGDGKPDIVVSTYGVNGVSVLLNTLAATARQRAGATRSIAPIRLRFSKARARSEK